MRRHRFALAARMLVGGCVGVAATLPAGTPAQGAARNVWAFAAALNPTPVPGEVLAAAYQYGSFRASCGTARARISEPSVGVYLVTFPCSASTRGIAHVTAIDPSGRYCTVGRWDANAGTGVETVRVNCYGVLGLPDHARFAVLYSTSSGLASGGGWYSYVRASAAGTATVSYNSIGATNGVAHLATGSCPVPLPKPGAVQVNRNPQ